MRDLHSLSLLSGCITTPDMAKVTLQPSDPTDSLSTLEAFAVDTKGSSAVPSVPHEEEGKKKKRFLVFFVHETGRLSACTKPVQRSPLWGAPDRKIMALRLMTALYNTAIFNSSADSNKCDSWDKRYEPKLLPVLGSIRSEGEATLWEKHYEVIDLRRRYGD